MKAIQPVVGALLLGTCLAAGAAAQETMASVADKQKQKQTVADIRKIGTALMSWLTDQVTTDDGSFRPAVSDEERDRFTTHRAESPEALKSYSLMSLEEVEALLVPDYLTAVPPTDGWGHPYQFAINSDLLAASVVAIRSPGRDGRFDTDDYEVGFFNFLEFHQDIAWSDGYFVRWPER